MNKYSLFSNWEQHGNLQVILQSLSISGLTNILLLIQQVDFNMQATKVVQTLFPAASVTCSQYQNLKCIQLHWVATFANLLISLPPYCSPSTCSF